MLCAKCHKNEATIHLQTMVNGQQEEMVDLCSDCAAGVTGFPTFDLKELEKFSVIGKKCEFCGKEAYSGQMVAGRGAVYWCFDCGLEFGRIVADLLVTERPGLMQRSKEYSFLEFGSDPELREWSEGASQKAMRAMKERKQGGRDQES